MALYQQQQRKAMLARASATAKPRGRASDDKRSFVEANLVAEAASPPKEGHKGPSLEARARATGLPLRTAKRALEAAAGKRAQLTAHEVGVSWSKVKRRKGHRKVTEAVRAALHEWILNHPRVVKSPVAKDTLLVFNPETKQKRSGSASYCSRSLCGSCTTT